MTSPLVQDVMSAAEQAAPDAPIVQVAAATVDTVSNPDASNILADIELFISLVRKLKAAHPSFTSWVKSLL